MAPTSAARRAGFSPGVLRILLIALGALLLSVPSLEWAGAVRMPNRHPLLQGDLDLYQVTMLPLLLVVLWRPLSKSRSLLLAGSVVVGQVINGLMDRQEVMSHVPLSGLTLFFGLPYVLAGTLAGALCTLALLGAWHERPGAPSQRWCAYLGLVLLGLALAIPIEDRPLFSQWVTTVLHADGPDYRAVSGGLLIGVTVVALLTAATVTGRWRPAATNRPALLAWVVGMTSATAACIVVLAHLLSKLGSPPDSLLHAWTLVRPLAYATYVVGCLVLALSRWVRPPAPPSIADVF